MTKSQPSAAEIAAARAKAAKDKKDKNIRIAKGIATLASGAKAFVSGGSSSVPTSANDSNPAEWKAEPVVNQTKEQLTTDLEQKSPKSFLSNYNDIA